MQIRSLAPVIVAFILAGCSGAKINAQTASEDEYPSEFSEKMPLYPVVLGSFDRRITTDSQQAQIYFDQGIQMMYAFTKIDAARSFREAWKEDPDCAMCYWGEAWAWGPYLNGRMREQDAPRAYAAIQKAVELKSDDLRRVESALIDAMAVRYVQDTDAVDRAVLDSTYARAMASVAERFPDDLDAATLYAESLFLLEPRRAMRDLDDPDVIALHSELERILSIDVKHPGAYHLYIHATESTVQPGKAEACAEYLGNAIPGASHINHMPSHTWNRVGRWGDAVTANIQAWHSDQKEEIGEGFAIYPSHNLHMLLFAASNDGQGAVAIQAGKDYGKLTGRNMYHVLTLVRFGRFEEIAEITARPDDDIGGGMWDFGQGYAALRRGDTDFASVYAARVKATAGSSASSFRGHSASRLLGIVGGILEGEIHRANGNLQDALEEFRAAVVLEDSLTYDEPEPLNFSAKHWYGNALNEGGQYAKAIDVFTAELEDHPKNGWSLHGMERALRGLGRNDEADEVHSQLQKAWARSDTWLRAPIF